MLVLVGEISNQAKVQFKTLCIIFKGERWGEGRKNLMKYK